MTKIKLKTLRDIDFMQNANVYRTILRKEAFKYLKYCSSLLHFDLKEYMTWMETNEQNLYLMRLERSGDIPKLVAGDYLIIGEMNFIIHFFNFTKEEFK